MLELGFARDKQGETSQVHPGLLAAHLRNGLFPVLGEIPQQRANHRLAQSVTRATQSSELIELHFGPRQPGPDLQDTLNRLVIAKTSAHGLASQYRGRTSCRLL